MTYNCLLGGIMVIFMSAFIQTQVSCQMFKVLGVCTKQNEVMAANLLYLLV